MDKQDVLFNGTNFNLQHRPVLFKYIQQKESDCDAEEELIINIINKSTLANTEQVQTHILQCRLTPDL